jgi:hypothetical protein
MLTKPYAALAIWASIRLRCKEVVPTRRPNRVPFDGHPLAAVLRFWWVVLSTDSRSGV